MASISLPEVVFRATDDDGATRVYVAFLFTDPMGAKYAVLTQDIEEGYPLHGATPKLDPSLLVEMSDNVSEEPYYLYSGVVDVRR
jgi:hypothetical protein